MTETIAEQKINPSDAAAELLRRRKARVDFGAYHQYCWWGSEPLRIGRHTSAIWDRINRAIDDYLEGVSTFLQIIVPFRHGKSDIVSIALPAFFLARCAQKQPDVIMAGYGAELVEGFSRKTKSVIKSPQYATLFPDVKLKPGHDKINQWGIEGSSGAVTVAGIGGSITGRGGALIVLDDYCKTADESESDVYRRRNWESFKDDLLTRRAPVSIVIVCATRRHVDDISGRIDHEIDTNTEFPRFEKIMFPAHDEKYVTDDNPKGYLFPERFSDDWYESQYATLGAHSAAALMDCNPLVRGGNRFQVDTIVYHDSLDEFPEKMRYIRFWDLASTEKERSKDDPDYTAGALVAYRTINGVPEIWIKDVAAFQHEAPRRNDRIIANANKDGVETTIVVESVAGYKDTFTTLRELFRGKYIVMKQTATKDKSVNAAPLEPLFDAGNVHVLRSAWNTIFYKQFSEFPNGKHDDVVDAVSGAFRFLKQRELTVVPSRAAMGL